MADEQAWILGVLAKGAQFETLAHEICEGPVDAIPSLAAAMIAMSLTGAKQGIGPEANRAHLHKTVDMLFDGLVKVHEESK